MAIFDPPPVIKITFGVINIDINYIVDGAKYIEDIYFFEVSTKYISSSASEKISIFQECVKMLIYTSHEMKFIWYLPKKVNFLFILYSMEIQKAQPNFFLGRLSFALAFAVCLSGITMGVNIVCT